jgi:predicted nucleic acid-binding protein
MDIYVDTCGWGRPYDDLTQATIQAEATAVVSAINACKAEGFSIVGSPMLILEISEIKKTEIRRKVMEFYTNNVTRKTPMTVEVEVRATVLQTGGLKVKDSFHAALAEAAGVDYLLTTDVKFESIAARLNLKTKVINPIIFLKEYYKWLLTQA